MAFKRIRNMKIYEQSDYHYKSTPTIMLKGQWLNELGFEYGTPICVECNGGKLVITRADEIKATFMKIGAEPVMCVAEPASEYGGECVMGKIIMCGSYKGGVGKSVTTYNLAYSLAEIGKKVLCVDYDSQVNLTTYFGIEDVETLPVSIGHMMMSQIEEEEMPETVEYIYNRNGVDFIPSSMVLSAADSKLRLEMGAEGMLSRILEPLRDSYDFILIDTFPSLGSLTINALAAADEVIITVNSQLLAMMGLQDFLKIVGMIRSLINNRLRVAGILLTMCDTRTNLCKVITEEVTETFQGQIRIFESRIPNTVKVGESVYYSEPLNEYAPGNGVCEAYRMLAKEVTCA